MKLGHQHFPPRFSEATLAAVCVQRRLQPLTAPTPCSIAQAMIIDHPPCSITRPTVSSDVLLIIFDHSAPVTLKTSGTACGSGGQAPLINPLHHTRCIADYDKKATQEVGTAVTTAATVHCRSSPEYCG